MPEEKLPKKNFRPVIEEIITDPTTDTVPQAQVVPTTPDTTPADNLPSPVAPASQIQPKKSFKVNMGFLGIVVAVALIVALVTGALYVYFNGVNSLKTSPEATPEPTPTQAPIVTATPQPTAATLVELDSYKVSVLNGSGKIGEAGKVSDLLEEAGFVVTSTGNAPNFSFKTTVIQAKSTVNTQAIAKAEQALEGSYEASVGDPLDAKAPFDIVVTVGAE